MVNTNIFDSIKDKASKLLPTPYTDIVEECTSSHLTEPIGEDVMLIIDSANTKPDAVEDVLRAVRSRLDSDDSGVQHLTILLLQALIQNCGPALHREVASQKILLRDLVNIAVQVPVNVRAMRAMEAARCLILNLSLWFADHSDPHCMILTTLVNDVRQAAGPNAFAGCDPRPPPVCSMTCTEGDDAAAPARVTRRTSHLACSRRMAGERAARVALRPPHRMIGTMSGCHRRRFVTATRTNRAADTLVVAM